MLLLRRLKVACCLLYSALLVVALWLLCRVLSFVRAVFLAQMLRDQLKERHEQHERGLKEDLELRHKSSKASLMRRRQMRRRSVSQSPCSRSDGAGGGGSSAARSDLDRSPLVVTAPAMQPSAAGAVEAVESVGPDLTKYRNMKTVRERREKYCKGG